MEKASKDFYVKSAGCSDKQCHFSLTSLKGVGKKMILKALAVYYTHNLSTTTNIFPSGGKYVKKQLVPFTFTAILSP